MTTIKEVDYSEWSDGTLPDNRRPVDTTAVRDARLARFSVARGCADPGGVED